MHRPSGRCSTSTAATVHNIHRPEFLYTIYSNLNLLSFLPRIVNKSFSAQQGAAPKLQFPMGVFGERSPGYIYILGNFLPHLPQLQPFIQKLLTANKLLDDLVCMILLVRWTRTTTWRYSDILIESVKLKVIMASSCCSHHSSLN